MASENDAFPQQSQEQEEMTPKKFMIVNRRESGTKVQTVRREERHHNLIFVENAQCSFRVCPFWPKKSGFTEKWKHGFCHFWPSEAFTAFVSLLDEFLRIRWLYLVAQQRPQRLLKARNSKLHFSSSRSEIVFCTNFWLSQGQKCHHIFCKEQSYERCHIHL